MSGFSIGTVEKITGIKAHILRYWENSLPFLRPQKDFQGRRLYTFHDIDLIFRIKYLVEVRKFTLECAGKQLLADLSQKGNSDYIIEISKIRGELLSVYRRIQESSGVRGR